VARPPSRRTPSPETVFSWYPLLCSKRGYVKTHADPSSPNTMHYTLTTVGLEALRRTRARLFSPIRPSAVGSERQRRALPRCRPALEVKMADSQSASPEDNY
jgi:DNA-binding PadR family transcriptional regulator